MRAIGFVCRISNIEEMVPKTTLCTKMVTKWSKIGLFLNLYHFHEWQTQLFPMVSNLLKLVD